jgi:hypothetical protein
MKWYSLFLLIVFMSLSCSLFDSGEENTNLSDITIMFNTQEAVLYPPFSPDSTDYYVSFNSYPRSFNLTATAEDSTSNITVNGVAAESGEEIHVDTNPPYFVVNVVITSADGKTARTYVFHILDGIVDN